MGTDCEADEPNLVRGMISTEIALGIIVLLPQAAFRGVTDLY